MFRVKAYSKGRQTCMQFCSRRLGNLNATTLLSWIRSEILTSCNNNKV